MEEYGKIRLYNARNDMLDMTNPDMFGADQEGLGVQFESEFRTADSHFLVEKSELQRKTLSLQLWLGDRTGQSYQRFSDLVAFLNHTPYRIEYETPTGTWSRDCILNELTKSLIKEESILVEELQLDFTTPFYIERIERTTDNPPIEGKAGKIYETVTRKRQVFESVPESYQEGDLWNWQGEDFPGRNYWAISKSPEHSYLIYDHSSGTYFNRNVSGSFATFYINKLSVTVDEKYFLSFEVLPHNETVQFTNGVLYINGMVSTTHNKPTLTKGLPSLVYGEFIYQTKGTNDIVHIYLNGLEKERDLEFFNWNLTKGTEHYPWSSAPEDLTNGKSTGYFIATKSSNEFNFNDFVYYGQSANENTYYDKIYDYTYSPEDYPTETEESYYTYDYVYADEDEGKNVFQVDNHSVYIGSSKHSPCEITIYGPCDNPHWQVTKGSKILQSDGFNLTVPEGHRLVVSSNPQSQRAVIIALDGTVSNVYQQQDLSKSNFVTFPVGRSKILFFNCDKVSFSYREERVTV